MIGTSSTRSFGVHQPGCLNKDACWRDFRCELLRSDTLNYGKVSTVKKKYREGNNIFKFSPNRMQNALDVVETMIDLFFAVVFADDPTFSIPCDLSGDM